MRCNFNSFSTAASNRFMKLQLSSKTNRTHGRPKASGSERFAITAWRTPDMGNYYISIYYFRVIYLLFVKKLKLDLLALYDLFATKLVL